MRAWARVLLLGVVLAALHGAVVGVHHEEDDVVRGLMGSPLGKRIASSLAAKRPNELYSFGIGKRSESESFPGGSESLLRPLRSPYSFGLGKRDPYAFGLGKRDPYAFGLGKRAQMYNVGLGKRDPYAFGLGKRDAYAMGLGK